MLLAWVLLVLCDVGVSGLYVIMKEGEMRCFKVEVPQDVLIVGDFQSFPLENEKNIGSSKPMTGSTQLELYNEKIEILQMDVEVKDSLGTVIHKREYSPTSRFAFTSPQGGEYSICFRTISPSWWNPLRWKFEIDIHTGADATDYEEIAKKEHLDSIQLSIRKLFDRAQDVRSEMAYQKEREKVFRSTSESTNARAAWWSVIQVAIVVATAYFQSQHLKTFFKKKKLI
uniref:GOLD domain-containing protein n=1 Tax=Arcella intermedia TaxID=1963864 RepID=A0A6B2LGN4_9EUKA